MRISDWSSDVCSSDLVSNVLAVDPLADGNFHRFLGAVVHHRQALDGTPVGQRIEDEVHRPGVVRPRRHLQRAALDGHAIALAALAHRQRSEEHTSELQSLMRILYAVICLKKKNKI